MTDKTAPRPGPYAMLQANRLFAEATTHLEANDAMAAMPLLQSCLGQNPSHYKAIRAVVAIAMQNGAAAQGREVLQDFFESNPLRTQRARQLGKSPCLLGIRGFSGTDVIPWRTTSGAVSTMFRGGHFSAQYLIAKPTFPEHNYTIVRGNILEPGALPAFDLMLNKIADPDVEEESLIALQSYLAGHPDTPIINHPTKVLRTTRDGNYQRLKDMAGVQFPQTHRVVFDKADAAEVAATITRLGLDDCPVILRATGTHTARTTALIRTQADIATYIGNTPLSGPYYLIRYIEVLFQRQYFRKLRLFNIDGTLYPTVCHIDQTWNVHGGNRKDMMRGNEALMDEEKRFLLDWRSYVGAANADRLEALIDDVGLEFFGIDFNIGPDGVLIYEMNAAMRHAYDHAKNFPYKMPFDLAITQAFTEMINRRLGA